MKLSIITGCYNEGRNLQEFIQSVYSSLSDLGLNDFEIVVVDESSDQLTHEIIEKLKSRYAEVRVIHNISRTGLLASQVEGIVNATGNYRIIMDCDLQHDPTFIGSIINGLENGNNIVIMSRFVEGASFRMNQYRYILSRTAGLLCRIILPYSRGIRDPTSGFYGLSGNFDIMIPGFKGTKSLLYIMALNPNLRAMEMPYLFKERKNGKSKIIRPSIFFSFLYEVIQFRRVSKASIEVKRTISSERSKKKSSVYHKL